MLKQFASMSAYVWVGVFAGIMLSDWLHGGFQRVFSALPITVVVFAVLASIAWYLRRRERTFR